MSSTQQFGPLPVIPQKPQHTARKVILIIAGAILTVIVIAVIATSGGRSSRTPALKPGSATADQICQAQVGSGVSNSLTGQNTGNTVVSESGATITSNLNTSGNEVVTCTFTLSDGSTLPVTVTLFPNGSTGWTETVAPSTPASAPASDVQACRTFYSDLDSNGGPSMTTFQAAAANLMVNAQSHQLYRDAQIAVLSWQPGNSLKTSDHAIVSDCAAVGVNS